jgi:RHS repeat-associated protein
VPSASNAVSSVVFDPRSLVHSSTDALNNTTTYDYDGAGRTVTVTSPDPGGGATIPFTTTTYDDNGNVKTVHDQTGHGPSYDYDAANRLTDQKDGDGNQTNYAYDLAGNLYAEQDPASNTTTYAYDALARRTSNDDSLGNFTYYSYDGDGNLVQTTDRDSRVVNDYYYLDQPVEEQWLNSSSAVVNTIDLFYGQLGQLLASSDPTQAYKAVYNGVGNLTSTDSVEPNMPEVVLAVAQDALGNLAALDATIAGTADFQNSYAYDGLGYLNLIKQTSGGGNVVADKRVDFTNLTNGQFDTINRYSDLTGTTLVALSSYTYDGAERLKTLTHSKGGTTYAGYSWQYDSVNRVTEFDNSAHTAENATYAFDNASQETSATYSNNTSSNETNTYDNNGNRNNNGFSLGTNTDNRLHTDGVYNYVYDNEGNIVERDTISDGSKTYYTWDNRNRLVEVTDKDSGGTTLRVVDYAYDMFNRLVSRTVTPYVSGSPGTPTSQGFAYFGNNMALAFDGSGNLTDRFLYGQAVDQILADEQVTSLGSAGTVYWMLADQEGTIRDVIDSGGTLQQHVAYDSFGKPTGTLNFDFGYTGKFYDNLTGLQWNLNRWYNPGTQRWMSQDPLGLVPDSNPYRYVGNSPTNLVDVSGLAPGDPLSFDGSCMGLAQAGWTAKEIAATAGITLAAAEMVVNHAQIQKAVEQFIKTITTNVAAKGLNPCDAARAAVEQAEKAIKSFKKNVVDHQNKIANPLKNMAKCYPGLSQAENIAIAIKDWQGDIKKNQFNLDVAERALKELEDAAYKACKHWWQFWKWLS